MFNHLYITNRMEHFSFKCGHAMQVAKLIKEDWLRYITYRLSLKYWSKMPVYTVIFEVHSSSGSCSSAI